MPRNLKLSALVATCSLLGVASAQTAAPAAAPAAPAGPPPPTTPAMVGSLIANPKPLTLDAGPLGKVFVTGVISGLGLWQDRPAAGDLGGLYDISNAQVFVQTTSGKLQFFAQGGAYSLPSLGTPYIKSDVIAHATFSNFPQGYLKYAPTDSFSVEAGKLPTLQGAECTFTFENFNIERGLLWNQENAVNRGFQANYSKGAWSASAAWTDGFYSNVLSSVSALISDNVSKSDVVSLVGQGNTARSTTNTFVTPITLNNSQVYNLIWTHTKGPWIVTPYLQYTVVPKWIAGGFTDSASTQGAALLASYALSGKYSGVTLPFRVEYIKDTGSAASGAPNLLYGQGSNAWSFTLTPTFQRGGFFVRAEGSYVTLGSITPGLGLGAGGNGKSQARLVLETGLVF